MPLPFIDRAPTASESQQIRLMMSSYCDGSGNLKEKGGLTTMPDWRQLERIIAEAMGVTTPENKGIFDVVVPNPDDPLVDLGISLKSKELGLAVLNDLAGKGRVYMELCNSPAKLWRPIKHLEISEQDFREKRYAQEIGNSIMETVVGWHKESAELSERQGRKLELEKSVYLTISYSKFSKNSPRRYQLHSFDLDFPEHLTWSYRTANCLKAEDPAYPGEVLFDWYALSGGQLKYYPRGSTCRFCSDVFTLLTPQFNTISKRAHMLWPKEWLATGAASAYSRDDLLDLVQRCVLLATTDTDRKILQESVEVLKATP